MVLLADWEWAVAGGFVFIAAVVRGFAGFGFSALSVVTLSFFMPPTIIVPIVLMMEIIASAWMLPGVWRYVDWLWLRPSAIGIFIGSPIGVAHAGFFARRDYKNYFIHHLGDFEHRRFGARAGMDSIFGRTGDAVSLVAGVMNGLAGLAGMVIALFLLATDRAAMSIRASLVILFFLSDIYALVWGGGFGLLVTQQLRILAIFLVPLIIGIIIGGRLFKMSDKGNYRAIALSLVFFTALFGIAHQALNLT